MKFDATTIFWLLFIAPCFVVGFAYSWMRMRKRIMQRYQQAVEKEIMKQVQQEILRSITQGPELQKQGVKSAARKQMKTASSQSGS